MDIPAENERLKWIIEKYYDGNQNQFSKDIGISQPRINRLFSVDPRTDKYPVVSYDIAQAVINKFIDKVSAEWFLTGIGQPLKREVPIARKSEVPQTGIPLIPVEAMAGYGQGEQKVMEYETERYVVPLFKDADFLIQIRGQSMYPRYKSGDLAACKRLALTDIFFQWGKAYVLDTAQGAITKRVKKSKKENHVLLVSDNEDYDPFDLHVEQINAIAIVLGILRLE